MSTLPLGEDYPKSVDVLLKEKWHVGDWSIYSQKSKIIFPQKQHWVVYAPLGVVSHIFIFMVKDPTLKSLGYTQMYDIPAVLYNVQLA